MTSFVLDNSVTIAWCFEDQSTSYTEAALEALTNGAEAVVPVIWKLEVANSLIVAERRKKLTPEKSADFIRALDQLNIIIDLDGLDHVFYDVLTHARLYQRSAYDASYLELAMRRDLPLATRDEPLRGSAQLLGVSLFQP